MPTYEYICKKCHKTFEAFQPITAQPLKKCIYCKGKAQRLISSGAGVIFKGSGFYETDYKKKTPKQPDKKQDSTSCPAQNASCKNCPQNTEK
jgi:putative FmdB family regulatory protein